MIPQEFTPDSCSTLQEWIDAGKALDFSNLKFLKLDLCDGVLCAIDSLIFSNYDVIKNYTTTLTLNDKEQLEYKCCPKKLSQDLYNTPELFYALMYINNCLSITDFKPKTITIFTPNIIDVLEELLMLCEDDMKKNRSSVKL